jgi:hypothetical protein
VYIAPIYSQHFLGIRDGGGGGCSQPHTFLMRNYKISFLLYPDRSSARSYISLAGGFRV